MANNPNISFGKLIGHINRCWCELQMKSVDTNLMKPLLITKYKPILIMKEEDFLSSGMNI